MGSVIPSLLVIWALAVAGYDLRQRRVPNLLLLVVAVPAVLSFGVFRQGLLGMGGGSSLLGLVVCALPYLPGYIWGKVGAGDVKFAGLQGFLLGGVGAFKAFIVSAVALGLIAVFAALAKSDRVHASRLPAAVALAVGFLWVVLGGYLLSGWGL
ncbi:MAG: prepilin peptidase [Nevskia sp.]|nr:prepilin peptidase [Nevskia sp.]